METVFGMVSIRQERDARQKATAEILARGHKGLRNKRRDRTASLRNIAAL